MKEKSKSSKIKDNKVNNKVDNKSAKQPDKPDALLDALKELKSKLKNFDELKKDYDLTDEHLTTKAVLRSMGETLEEYIKILIQLLQPEEFHSLHECTVFDDNDKAKIFDLYKNLMITHREILKAEIQNDENNNIATINLVDAEMKLLKPQILKIVVKMQSAWRNVDAKGRVGYVG